MIMELGKVVKVKCCFIVYSIQLLPFSKLMLLLVVNSSCYSGDL